MLEAHMDRPLVSAGDAQTGAAHVKAAVASAVSRLRPRRIELYYAGPAAFAVALGHRWNAMPPTDLYEFNASSGSYVPTASVE